MKAKLSYSLLFLSLLFSACSTDLEVIGKYKETMVVYGLLDQSQAKQYIKINKAFLGEGNAFQYAQIKDSVQFVNSLNVKLQKLNAAGTVISEKTLLPDNTVPKDPGTFYAPDQANAIYSIDSTSLGTGFFNTNNTYRLIAKNNESGTEVSATTSLISDIGNGGLFVTPIVSPSPFVFIVANSPTYPFSIKWVSGKNARLYQTVLRFNYLDSFSATHVDTMHLDWVFPVQTTQSLDGGESMETKFIGEDFMRFIGNQISVNPSVVRRSLKTDILLIAGSDDLSTYIQVNAPSTGLVQDKPVFTNITNGLGIFTSRYNKPPFSKHLNGTTLDTLSCGQYTGHLNFLNSTGSLLGCAH